ncbi:hypothetical protein PIB30_072813 [Stylosanthes scabra]|uniref:Uncharacterized protein n=1 Tax=Stylosanthes scabra TaxID=79078 RepID=A0ABU6QPA9_9FABA|nr:hypothetical protein [Stylosanthes scabra]
MQDRIIGKIHNGEVVAKDGRRMRARLSELVKKIQDPLYLRERGGVSTVLGLGGAATPGELLRALPGDEIRPIKDAISRRRSLIIRSVNRVGNIRASDGCIL